MNKEQLEKMFDENFASSIDNEYYTQHLNFIKEFIFETIIPEVLKDLIEWNYYISDVYIKQKTKELYWITL